MAHKGWAIVVLVILIVIGAISYWIVSFDISAVQNPGAMETSIAATMRGWYIGREARDIPAPILANNASSVSQGEGMYGMECAQCHGKSGHEPMPIGKSMYPRVPSLSSSTVQQMSDKELFWVIKNGVRLSGMPGFAKINSDLEIWQIAFYVHSLGTPAR